MEASTPDDDTAVFQTRHGPMRGFVGDQFITRSFEVYGEYSGLERALFDRVIRPGDTVVEVGANVGAHTVPMARKCAPGRLYAYEPQRRVFEVLCANLAANGVENVTALHEAAGDAQGSVVVPEVDYRQHRNPGSISVSMEGPGERVPLTRVDDLDLGACRLLKVDVEGFEPDVLRGARETIQRCRPILYVENDRAANQQEIISLIEELGYRQWWHKPPLFDAGNFNGATENVFPHIISLNIYALHRDSGDAGPSADPIDPCNWVSPIRAY